ncbi:MAG: hypothetical protein LBB50_07010 [Oscillospiraceae bacterium]|jgi:hypothetical protein|nr:hypothetical protein [Oscillospiraceae bacterium]
MNNEHRIPRKVFSVLMSIVMLITCISVGLNAFAVEDSYQVLATALKKESVKSVTPDFTYSISPDVKNSTKAEDPHAASAAYFANGVLWEAMDAFWKVAKDVRMNDQGNVKVTESGAVDGETWTGENNTANKIASAVWQKLIAGGYLTLSESLDYNIREVFNWFAGNFTAEHALLDEPVRSEKASLVPWSHQIFGTTGNVGIARTRDEALLGGTTDVNAIPATLVLNRRWTWEHTAKYAQYDTNDIVNNSYRQYWHVLKDMKAEDNVADVKGLPFDAAQADTTRLKQVLQGWKALFTTRFFSQELESYDVEALDALHGTIEAAIAAAKALEISNSLLFHYGLPTFITVDSFEDAVIYNQKLAPYRPLVDFFNNPLSERELDKLSREELLDVLVKARQNFEALQEISRTDATVYDGLVQESGLDLQAAQDYYDVILQEIQDNPAGVASLVNIVVSSDIVGKLSLTGTGDSKGYVYAIDPKTQSIDELLALYKDVVKAYYALSGSVGGQANFTTDWKTALRTAVGSTLGVVDDPGFAIVSALETAITAMTPDVTFDFNAAANRPDNSVYSPGYTIDDNYSGLPTAPSVTEPEVAQVTKNPPSPGYWEAGGDGNNAVTLADGLVLKAGTYAWYYAGGIGMGTPSEEWLTNPTTANLPAGWENITIKADTVLNPPDPTTSAGGLAKPTSPVTINDTTTPNGYTPEVGPKTGEIMASVGLQPDTGNPPAGYYKATPTDEWSTVPAPFGSWDDLRDAVNAKIAEKIDGLGTPVPSAPEVKPDEAGYEDWQAYQEYQNKITQIVAGINWYDLRPADPGSEPAQPGPAPGEQGGAPDKPETILEAKPSPKPVMNGNTITTEDELQAAITAWVNAYNAANNESYNAAGLEGLIEQHENYEKALEDYDDAVIAWQAKKDAHDAWQAKKDAQDGWATSYASSETGTANPKVSTTDSAQSIIDYLDLLVTRTAEWDKYNNAAGTLLRYPENAYNAMLTAWKKWDDAGRKESDTALKKEFESALSSYLSFLEKNAEGEYVLPTPAFVTLPKTPGTSSKEGEDDFPIYLIPNYNEEIEKYQDVLKQVGIIRKYDAYFNDFRLSLEQGDDWLRYSDAELKIELNSTVGILDQYDAAYGDYKAPDIEWRQYLGLTTDEIIELSTDDGGMLPIGGRDDSAFTTAWAQYDAVKANKVDPGDAPASTEEKAAWLNAYNDANKTSLTLAELEFLAAAHVSLRPALKGDYTQNSVRQAIKDRVINDAMHALATVNSGGTTIPRDIVDALKDADGKILDGYPQSPYEDIEYCIYWIGLFSQIKDVAPYNSLTAQQSADLELLRRALALVKGIDFEYETIHWELMGGENPVNDKKDWYPTREVAKSGNIVLKPTETEGTGTDLVIKFQGDEFPVKYEHIENVINKLDTLLTSNFINNILGGDDPLVDLQGMLFGSAGTAAEASAAAPESAIAPQGVADEGIPNPVFSTEKLGKLQGDVLMRMGQMRTSKDSLSITDPYTGVTIVLPPLNTARDTNREVDPENLPGEKVYRRWIQSYRADVLLYLLHFIFEAINTGDADGRGMLSWILHLVMPVAPTTHEVTIKYVAYVEGDKIELLKTETEKVNDGAKYTLPDKFYKESLSSGGYVWNYGGYIYDVGGTTDTTVTGKPIGLEIKGDATIYLVYTQGDKEPKPPEPPPSWNVTVKYLNIADGSPLNDSSGKSKETSSSLLLNVSKTITDTEVGKFYVALDQYASYVGYAVDDGEITKTTDPLPEVGPGVEGSEHVINLYFELINDPVGPILISGLEDGLKGAIDLSAATKPFLTELLTGLVSDNLYSNMLPNTIIGLYKMISDMVWPILAGPLFGNGGLLGDISLDLGGYQLSIGGILGDMGLVSVNDILESSIFKELFIFLGISGVTSLLEILIGAEITPYDLSQKCWPDSWPKTVDAPRPSSGPASEAQFDYAWKTRAEGGIKEDIAKIYAFLSTDGNFTGDPSLCKDKDGNNKGNHSKHVDAWWGFGKNGTPALDTYLNWNIEGIDESVVGAGQKRKAFEDSMAFAMSGIGFLLSVVFSDTPLTIKFLDDKNSGQPRKDDRFYVDIIIGMEWVDDLVNGLIDAARGILVGIISAASLGLAWIFTNVNDMVNGWIPHVSLNIAPLYVSSWFGDTSYDSNGSWPHWKGKYDSRAGLEMNLSAINAYGKLFIPLFELLNIDPVLFGEYKVSNTFNNTGLNTALNAIADGTYQSRDGNPVSNRYSEATLNALVDELCAADKGFGGISGTVRALNGSDANDKADAKATLYEIAHVFIQSLLEPLLNWVAPEDEELIKYGIGFRPVGKIIDLLPNLAFVVENGIIPNLVNNVLDDLTLKVELCLGGLNGGALEGLLGEVLPSLIDNIKGMLQNILGDLVNTLITNALGGGDVAKFLGDILGKLTSFVTPALTGIINLIVGALGSVSEWLVNLLPNRYWYAPIDNPQAPSENGRENLNPNIFPGSKTYGSGSNNASGLQIGTNARAGTLGSILGFFAGDPDFLTINLFNDDGSGAMKLGSMVTGLLTYPTETNNGETKCVTHGTVHAPGIIGYLDHMIGIDLTGNLNQIIQGALGMLGLNLAPTPNPAITEGTDAIFGNKAILALIDTVVKEENNLEGFIFELFNPQTYPVRDFMHYALLDQAQKGAKLNEVNYSDIWTRQKAEYLQDHLMPFLDNMWDFLFAQEFLPWLYDLLGDSLGLDITNIYTTETLELVLNLLGPLLRGMNLNALLIDMLGGLLGPKGSDGKNHDLANYLEEVSKTKETTQYPFITHKLLKLVAPLLEFVDVPGLLETVNLISFYQDDPTLDLSEADTDLGTLHTAFMGDLATFRSDVKGVKSRDDFTDVLYGLLAPIAPLLKVFLTGGRTVDENGKLIETIWYGELTPNNGAKDIGYYSKDAKEDYTQNVKRYLSIDGSTEGTDLLTGEDSTAEKSNYISGAINGKIWDPKRSHITTQKDVDGSDVQKETAPYDPNGTFYTIGAAGNNLTLIEDFFGFSGYDGYRQALIPIFEHVGIPQSSIPDYEQFVKRSTGNNGNAEFFKMLLDPILDLVDGIIADPINEVVRILPNLLYFLVAEDGNVNQELYGADAGATNLTQALNRLLRPIYAILDMLRPVINTGTIFGLLNSPDLNGMLTDGDLPLNLDLGGIKLAINLPLNISISDILGGLLDSLLPGVLEGIGLGGLDVDIGQLTSLICGELVQYKSKNGQNDAVRLDGNLPDLLTNLLRRLLEIVFAEGNYEQIEELLKTVGIPAEIQDFVLGLIGGFAGLLSDKTLKGHIGADMVLNIVFYLFYDLDSLGYELLAMRDTYSSRIIAAFEYVANSRSPQLRRFAERARRMLDLYYTDIISGDKGVQENGFVSFVTNFFGKVSDFFTSFGDWFMKIIRWLFPYFF